MSDNLYNELSEERKELQNKGLIPVWASTGGWSMFKQKYLYGVESWRGQIERIAKTAAAHTNKPEYFEKRFFEILWKGWLSPSTPVLANMGTDRGLPVSCSGCYVEDSVAGFYEAATEIAVLSKWGFGTSAYLGDVRHRGADISVGGKSSGKLPVIKNLIQVCRDISQGSARRGAGAWYLSIDDFDFWEILHHLEANPDGFNVGWNVTDEFISKLNSGDDEALDRYQAALRVKMTLGKGYFFFVDKANRQRPAMYKNLGLDIKASQLCSEIMLHSSSEYSYSCVLSSMNVALYDEWKDTDAVQIATIFLDCVASEFIKKAKGIKHLEKVVAFTEKGRALGLGQMGLFSLFQKRRLDPEGFDAYMLNVQVAKHIDDESKKASIWMASAFGEPEWCKGYGLRNTHRIATAPTKSTALIMGGWSEGINPEPAMAFSASTAAGDIDRVSPVLIDLMNEKKLNISKSIKAILANGGSVKGLDFLTEEEQSWFKTAFEIDQNILVNMAAARQKHTDQGQSLNLFFAHNDTEEYISEVHQNAFMNENILSLYYVYSSTDIKAERTDECESCM